MAGQGALAKAVKAEGLHLPLKLSWGAEGGEMTLEESQQGDLTECGAGGRGTHQVQAPQASRIGGGP